MKKAVTVVYILSVVLIALFSVVLIASIIGKMFSAPDGSEPLDIIFSKGIYNIFIILALTGILNSILLFVCIRFFAKRKLYSIKNKNIFKSIPFISAALCNLLFYLFAVIVFTSHSYIMLAIPIVWVISLILFILSFTDFKYLY